MTVRTVCSNNTLRSVACSWECQHGSWRIFTRGGYQRRSAARLCCLLRSYVSPRLQVAVGIKQDRQDHVVFKKSRPVPLWYSQPPSHCAEALAAIGESNADNWVVMQKGLPLLIAMLQAPDLRQAEAAVRSWGTSVSVVNPTHAVADALRSRM